MNNIKCRFLATLLAVVMVFSAMPITTLTANAATVSGNTTEFAGGSGTEVDPYLISTVDHLYNIRNHLSAHYEMINDIDLTKATAVGGLYDNEGYGWSPIGGTFSGTFNGKGFEIIGLRIKPRSSAPYGLFASVSNGTIKNLGMHNGIIEANYYGYPYVGFIAGSINNSTIEKCYNTGNITLTGLDATSYAGETPMIGGLVGRSVSSKISMCYNTGNISAKASGDTNGWSSSGHAEVGGICGRADESNVIRNCYNTGDLYATRYSWSSNIYGGSCGMAVGIRSDFYTSYNIGTAGHSITINSNNYGSQDSYNCYHKSGCATKDGSTALNESQMGSQQFYTGFDFENVWDMGGNPDYLYPELKCFFIEGNVKIIGNVCYDETLTATIENLNYKNVTVNYKWYVDNEIVSESQTYQVKANDIGKELRVKAISTHERHPGNVFSNTVIVKKGIQKDTPKESEITTITDKMIVVSTQLNQEYSIDNTKWQQSGEFNNLDPNKEYTIYTRITENELYQPSNSRIATKATTDRRPLSGKVSITGTARYGDTLTADVSGLLPTGATFAYEWKSGGEVVGTGSTYTITQADIGNSIVLYVKGTDDYIGTISSAAVVATKTTVQLPNAPVVVDKTNTTVTLQEKADYEYSMDKVKWQDSPVFTGLSVATEYTFYQRAKETDTTFASISSNGTKETTLKNTIDAPAKPVVEKITNNSVTLKEVDGYEYSMDGLQWQTSNIFTGLNPYTEYSFCQRIAENKTDFASAQSSYAIVITLKNTVATPAAPTIEKATATSVTLVDISGYEYSIDGTTWQTNNVFTGLTTLETYTFYQRIKETNTDYTSEMSAGTSFKVKYVAVVPEAPALLEKTNNSIVVSIKDGYEYSIDQTMWNVTGEFTGLQPNQTYTVYCRIPETDTHYASVVSNALTVTTLKYSVSAPSAPVLSGKNSNSVTLVLNSTYEYSKDGITWQMSNVFNDLSPNTEYNFYQRVAETSTAYASDKSSALTVRTPKQSVSTPSAPTLSTKTATSVTLVKTSGYEYSKDGNIWQSSNVFDGLKPNTQYSFYRRKAETDTAYASGTSAALTVTTPKNTAGSANAVVTIRVTATSVTLLSYTGYEYSKDGITWQKSNVFTGLSANTSYRFYQRIAETADTYASATSARYVTTAAKSACSISPAAPMVAETTTNKVVLVAREGYEYSRNGTSWQKSNTFSGLSSNTSYTFYQRIAECDSELASSKSSGVTVKTFSSVSGTTAATNYDRLRNYINTYGSTTSNGNKCIVRTTTTSGGLTIYYSLENTSSGIEFGLLFDQNTSTKLAGQTKFTLSRSTTTISVYSSMLYYYLGTAYDAVSGTKDLNRSTYSASTTYPFYQSGSIILGSNFSENFNQTLELLCTYWDVYIYSNLGFGLRGLGFTSFSGNGTTVCDPLTSYHNGNTETRNAYSGTCTINGYSGDTYCATCGEKLRTGYSLSCRGYHSYSGCCDKDCNVCGEERRTPHTSMFPDVHNDAWYLGSVEFAVEKGYFSGNGDGTFAPGKDITRQDFVVVLSRIAGANLSKYSGKTSFTDVPANAYYAKAIHWATDTGIISGYNATQFGVGDPLTREQLVTILSRYAQKKGVNVNPTAAALNKMNSYSDANKINPYMRNAIAWALQNKVINGMTSTTIAPQGNATRAQVAAILMNINAYKVIPGI